MTKPSYNYIRFLPRNRIIVSTVSSLLNSPYIKGIFSNNVYGYRRDDNGIETLPSLSVYHGVLSSPDNYDRIVGTILMDCYSPLNETREDLTESIDTILETIRITIQNNNFFVQVSLDQFDYNKSLSSFRNEFDKIAFKNALKTKNPLVRYGIDFYAEQPTVANPAEISDCQKTKMSFKYWIAQQNYYELLDILGIDGYHDPNRIIYPPFVSYDINIAETDAPQ